MDTLPYNNTHINSWYIFYKPQLLETGLNFGLKSEEIKDLINQFFLDLLEKQIDPATIINPQAFIKTSFKRRLIDYNRLSKKRTTFQSQVSLEGGLEPSFCDTFDKMQSYTELKNKIKKEYDKLPARCKKVIYLKFYEGKTTEEIAGLTGLSKRTVYNNLFEGISILRQEFVGKQKLSSKVFLSLLMSMLF